MRSFSFLNSFFIFDSSSGRLSQNVVGLSVNIIGGCSSGVELMSFGEDRSFGDRRSGLVKVICKVISRFDTGACTYESTISRVTFGRKLDRSRLLSLEGPSTYADEKAAADGV